MAITAKQLVAHYREEQYRALKAKDFDLYRRSIQAAEAVSLNYNLPHHIAADIESAVVLMVADALGLNQ